MSRTKLANGLIAAAVVAALLFLPVVAAYCLIGDRVLFNFLSGDSMYYMWIANNVLKFGIPTADGMHATNGFHPLWQWLLVELFRLTSVKHNQVYITFFASAVCVYAAYAIVSCGLLRMLGTVPGLVATLLLFPGIYGLCFEPRRHMFGAPGLLYTLYPMSAINGMETPLSLLCWAIFFASFVPRLVSSGGAPDVRALFPWPVRLVLPAIVLSRLDDGFLVVAIMVFILLQPGLPMRGRIRRALQVCWPALLVMAAYLAYNRHTVGVWLPVSAAAKTKMSMAGNMEDMAMTLTGRYLPSWWNWASRLYPVLFSLLVGGLSVAYGWRRRADRFAAPQRAALSVPGLYLCLKSLFLLTMVWHYDQGYWYYFAMIGVCNVMFAIMAGQFIRYHGRYRKAAVYFCLAVLALRTPNDIHYAIASTENNRNSADYAYILWNDGDRISRDLLDKAPHAKIIDSWDGMFGYMLDLPAESCTGWISDPQEIKNRHAVGVWRSLVSRRYTLVPEFGYVDRRMLPPDIVRVVDVIQLPSFPVPFLKLELAPGIPPVPAQK